MTIKDIAKLSGYGIGTVSRVINKQPGVSEKAREKILKIIEESNFEPNGNARKLKRCGGNTVTIIMKGRHNSFFMEILDRITLLLSELDEVVSCQIIDEDGDEVAEALKFVRDKTSKAIIFLGANLALFDERMNELEIPCVVATTSARELAFDNVSSVCVDDEAATMELVQYLTGYGHKDIVVMGGEISDKQISFSRYLGCKKGFEKSGLEFDPDKNYMACRYSYEAGYETTKKLLEKNIHVTAIVGLSDTRS
jgi:DNA-binding LacI/PurR family transcriptional regulator